MREADFLCLAFAHTVALCVIAWLVRRFESYRRWFFLPCCALLVSFVVWATIIISR